jgi:hypothetical protein
VGGLARREDGGGGLAAPACMSAPRATTRVAKPTTTRAARRRRRSWRRLPAALARAARVFLENFRCVECVLCSGITSVKHDDSDAKVIDGLHVDRFKPEGAVAIL